VILEDERIGQVGQLLFAQINEAQTQAITQAAVLRHSLDGALLRGAGALSGIDSHRLTVVLVIVELAAQDEAIAWLKVKAIVSWFGHAAFWPPDLDLLQRAGWQRKIFQQEPPSKPDRVVALAAHRAKQRLAWGDPHWQPPIKQSREASRCRRHAFAGQIAGHYTVPIELSLFDQAQRTIGDNLVYTAQHTFERGGRYGGLPAEVSKLVDPLPAGPARLLMNYQWSQRVEGQAQLATQAGAQCEAGGL